MNRAEFQHVNSDHPWAALVHVAHADSCGPIWKIWAAAFESSDIVMAAMAHWRPEYSLGQKSLLFRASYGMQQLYLDEGIDSFRQVEVREKHDLDMRAHRFIMVFST